MGAHMDLAQGAVVAVGAVVGALLYGAFDAFVFLHNEFLLIFGFRDSIPRISDFIPPLIPGGKCDIL